MQKELDTLGLPVAVGILGVNAAGYESGNANACDGRDIPWLQETAQMPVWTTWQVGYRDVVVLDQDNRRIAVYNLTVHDLNDPANFEELKGLLAAAAGAGTP